MLYSVNPSQKHPQAIQFQFFVSPVMKCVVAVNFLHTFEPINLRIFGYFLMCIVFSSAYIKN